MKQEKKERKRKTYAREKGRRKNTTAQHMVARV
jgi:hypothetical protein